MFLLFRIIYDQNNNSEWVNESMHWPLKVLGIHPPDLESQTPIKIPLKTRKGWGTRFALAQNVPSWKGDLSRLVRNPLKAEKGSTICTWSSSSSADDDESLPGPGHLALFSQYRPDVGWRCQLHSGDDFLVFHQFHLIFSYSSNRDDYRRRYCIIRIFDVAIDICFSLI